MDVLSIMAVGLVGVPAGVLIAMIASDLSDSGSEPPLGIRRRAPRRSRLRI
jgi:hypothetical protein